MGRHQADGVDAAVILHFAYGSNMCRPLMRARCSGAIALGATTLPGWRFIIGPNGYASIVRQPGGVVHGVLWQLDSRGLAALNAYENVAGGLYERRRLPVRQAGRCQPALVYVACRRGEGTPRPGYLALVVGAARDWALPEPYVQSLQRWAPSGWPGVRATETGEIA